MELILQHIENLFNTIVAEPWDSIQKIPQSGGDRMYFRIILGNQSWIATYNLNSKENQTFIYFAHHFNEKGMPVPKVLAVNEQETVYLQEDVGTVSLLDVLEKEGKTEAVFLLFQKSLTALAQLQIEGAKGLDYNRCITSKYFGKNSILTDLLYYKYYFLDTLQYPYDKQALIDEFEIVSDQLAVSHFDNFMFRDFQSRNIMVKNGEPALVSLHFRVKSLHMINL